MNPDQQAIAKSVRFCGEPVSRDRLALITRIVTQCGGLSRTELANTVCELFGWARPNGKLKTVECRQFLEQLQACSRLPHEIEAGAKAQRSPSRPSAPRVGHCTARSNSSDRSACAW